jgi:hypothetical protein
LATTTTRSRARKPAPKLPDNVRLALRRYFPTEISARSAAYYALPEHLALLRLRSEAESRMLRWNDVAEDLQRELPDLAIRASECTAFSNSYELEILLHENVPFPDRAENLTDVVKRGPMRTAHLAASFLLPYWNLQFRKWRKSRLGAISLENVPQEGRHSTRVVNAVAKILKKHGWKRIPPNLAQTKIPGIDLEHVEKGEVRVADVVFGELSDSPF